MTTCMEQLKEEFDEIVGDMRRLAGNPSPRTRRLREVAGRRSEQHARLQESTGQSAQEFLDSVARENPADYAAGSEYRNLILKLRGEDPAKYEQNAANPNMARYFGRPGSRPLDRLFQAEKPEPEPTPWWLGGMASPATSDPFGTSAPLPESDNFQEAATARPDPAFDHLFGGRVQESAAVSSIDPGYDHLFNMEV